MSETKRTNVKELDFITAVVGCTYLCEVAEKFNLKPESVYHRYAKYRAEGKALPDRPMNPPSERGPRTMGTDEANALIAKLQAEQAQAQTPETPAKGKKGKKAAETAAE